MADPWKQGPRDRGRDEDERLLRLALAQLPTRMRRALRLFRDLTGFTAVTSLGAWDAGRGTTVAISPPVHPRCASQIRRTKSAPPCEEQWRWHVRTGRRTHRAQRHICPLGLRCSCVPILYGETLVGTAKLVAGPDTADRQFSVAARALELAVSRVCQDFHVSALTEELKVLRREVTALREVRRRARVEHDRPRAAAAERVGRAHRARTLPAGATGEGPQERDAHDGSLVDRTLAYLGAHYLEPGLSLAGVGRALQANDKYLTHLFTRVVGERMHEYIVGLRVQHACRMLLSCEKQIKEIAYESGFQSPERFRRVFFEHVGVGAATYRRLFKPS